MLVPNFRLFKRLCLILIKVFVEAFVDLSLSVQYSVRFILSKPVHKFFTLFVERIDFFHSLLRCCSWLFSNHNSLGLFHRPRSDSNCITEVSLTVMFLFAAVCEAQLRFCGFFRLSFLKLDLLVD